MRWIRRRDERQRATQAIIYLLIVTLIAVEPV
jgi:hypothetical protein